MGENSDQNNSENGHFSRSAGDLYAKEANEKSPDNCKYPAALLQAAQNQKQTNAEGLAMLLKLKIGLKIMLKELQTCISRIIRVWSLFCSIRVHAGLHFLPIYAES